MGIIGQILIKIAAIIHIVKSDRWLLPGNRRFFKLNYRFFKEKSHRKDHKNTDNPAKPVSAKVTGL